jgi:DNA-binding transcriptional LysR family regulator
MALDYMRMLGGSAFLPRRMLAGDLAAGSLHIVADAPEFRRPVFAVYAVRTAQLELIQHCIALL